MLGSPVLSLIIDTLKYSAGLVTSTAAHAFTDTFVIHPRILSKFIFIQISSIFSKNHLYVNKIMGTEVIKYIAFYKLDNPADKTLKGEFLSS
ncbi:MAG: hypothetical protein AUJ85_02505 [Elusimicrobia bacterium CG1_02_37_114]|nr:MAG: hypothetical protein AUJ85_02505 [Elusimicrobia bacterium CG1_02_37_114]PIV52629.1 MAG: hypothetical protein COS17_08190 [Elusimicrobia bacterium CG02_land_8_20_14_3_00_37_13]PIZ13544.1 MAG: hypothetical protein COY53_04295 [Elusimicrobia bacterium CG_4_10_14_0_8_um_filter_37_32]